MELGKKISITKFKVLLYTIMIAVIIISLYVNKNFQSTPRNILNNFVIPSFLVFFGLSCESLNEIYKIVLLVTGGLWFIYIALHYLIGFHNPYWGN